MREFFSFVWWKNSWGSHQQQNEEEIPKPKFDISQEVMSKDFPGSLSSELWETKVLERSHAKRLSAGDKDRAIIDQHQTDCCWTYYVQHYQGWNTDKWVNEDDILDTEEVPKPKFDIDHKVLARDLPRSSLLHEAKVLLRFYSKRLSDDNNNSATMLGQHQTECCWSYYVHYQGWNHKLDDWCYEDEVFDDSIDSRELAEQLRLESTNRMKVGRSKKTRGKKTSLNGKNDAIVSNEQPAQTKRKIDDAAVGNKGTTRSSKRRTSSHFADSNLSVKPSPEKENSSTSLEIVEEPARQLFAELENNQASKSLFNDQSLVVLMDSGKNAHRAIKHDCLLQDEGVRIVKRNPDGQIYFVEDLHKHVHCSVSSKQSADLQKVCKNVEVIETNANVFQKDFAVWNADDEEHPFLEDTAKLIQKVFAGFQTAMKVPKKDDVRGTIATNVGLTTTDCNQYSENRTTILETVKPFLTKLVCITH